MYSNTRYNSSKEKNIEELIEFITSKSYGDTIPIYTAADILKYNIEDEKELKKFKSMMCRVKNALIEYGYVLKTISGIGYYILKPKQISSYCYRTYMTRTQNLLEKSEKILNHTDKEELTETRIEEYNNAKQLNEELIENLSKTIITSKYYDRKAYYDSLKD